MGTSLLSALLVGITVVIVLLILAVVTLFVVVGATRLFSSRKELSSIDITDGIDESEMAIIRSVLLKKSSADKEAAVKAKLAEVSKP